MNFKQQAVKLEKFLEEEFKNKVPLIVLPDNTLVYKRFKIKKNRKGCFDLTHINNDIIDTFKLKATAAIAAKKYHYNRFDLYNNIKNLDTEYWTNSIDSLLFKQRFYSCKNTDKKLIYLARWELTEYRAKHYKEQITMMFRSSF
jgi:hypothetical protein